MGASTGASKRRVDFGCRYGLEEAEPDELLEWNLLVGADADPDRSFVERDQRNLTVVVVKHHSLGPGCVQPDPDKLPLLRLGEFFAELSAVVAVYQFA